MTLFLILPIGTIVKSPWCFLAIFSLAAVFWSLINLLRSYFCINKHESSSSTNRKLATQLRSLRFSLKHEAVFIAIVVISTFVTMDRSNSAEWMACTVLRFANCLFRLDCSIKNRKKTYNELDSSC